MTMIRFLLSMMAALAMATPVHAEWFFRGTPNDWDKTALEVTGSAFTTCQTFAGVPDPRFKIDRLGDWAESYPAQDYRVADGTYRILFAPLTRQVSLETVSDCSGTDPDDETWYFRGTPNQWGMTPMKRTGNGNEYETCQTFQGDPDPRFKIDHFGDWRESYPAQDRRVAQGSHKITFDADSRGISTVAVQEGCEKPSDTWYFRGTSNAWGTEGMKPIEGTANHRIQVAFAGEDPNPRFKIDHFGDWRESHPPQDMAVQDCSRYRITFDADTKDIDTERLGGVSEGKCAPQMSIEATPPPGKYDTPQSISLSVEHPQGLPVSLHYTTDHTDPTSESKRYAGESIQADDLGLDLDLDLRVLAVDSDGTSKSANFPYRIGAQTGDFREETIYFLLTTRFYDGDPDNNYYNRDRIKIGDPHWRGDFKGLIQKLDYIKELGFTAIWITPPVENRSGLDYHGYHAYDWTRVDPRLESQGATYQDLIDAAHAKGLKVIQDVVINHSSQYGIRQQVWIDHLPIKYYRPASGVIDNGPYQGNLGDYRHPFREDNDNPVAPEWFRARQMSDPDGTLPLDDPIEGGGTVPQPGYWPNRFFGIVDAQALDPDWYHLDGFIAGGDWENPQALQRKHLAGDTIDLATERDNVKAYLNDAIFGYLDMGVDAIRVDTVKHVERDNLLEYVNAWKAHKPGLFVFGENLVKGTGLGDLANDNGPSDIRPWWYTRLGDDRRDPRSGGDSGFSVLDFSLFSTFRDNLSRGHYGGIGGILAWDWIYGDATKLVTFLQNHDVGPDNDFKYRFKGDTWMAAAAYNMLWTIRGIPTLYYGEEIEFMKGAPQDIEGPDMTIDQTGRAYFGDHLEQGMIEATKGHPLWRHIQRLNQIRAAIPALQKGSMSHLNEFGSGMTFVRDYKDGESYAVVGLAIGGDRHMSIDDVRNGEYVDAVTGNRVAVSSGTLSFHVKGNSAGIYVLDGTGKIGSDGQFLR
jgi:glycosidase